MKKIIIHSGILIVAFIALLLSCAKNKDFIKDNARDTGVGYYPQSANTLVDMTVPSNPNLNNASYAGGATFKTELQFISQSPIKEINLYTTVGTGARTKVSTTPYASAYSAAKGTDTLLVPYTVPTNQPVGTSIKLEYEILNMNGLSLIRTATIKTK